MRLTTCVLVLMTLGAGTAAAGENTCASLTARPALMAAVGGTLDDQDLSGTRPAANHDPVRVGHGAMVSARGEIPMRTENLGLRLEIDRAAVPVHIDGERTPDRRWGSLRLPRDWASTSHIGAGRP